MRVIPFHRRIYDVASLIGWATVLLVPVVLVHADDEVISFTCEGTTCLECLDNGCGWFPSGGEPDIPGECVSTCSIIADAPCYAEEYFTGQSPEEICNIVTTDENDWNICSAVTDCAQCTATAKSDGTSKCVWYEISENCGSGNCNFLGCGSSVCLKESDVVVDNPATAPTVLRATQGPTLQPIVRVDIENPTLLPLSPTSSDVNNPTTLGPVPLVDIETSVCDRLSTADCTTCIASGCGWANDEFCIPSCRTIADTTCYDNTTFPDMTEVAEICEMARVVETTPTVSPGPTPATCETTATTCDACISDGCGWVVGSACLTSCSKIADAPCFDNTTFFSVTNVTEICTLAEKSLGDISLCSTQTSCSSCRSVQLAAPDSQCSWYEAQDGFSFPSTCCIGCDVPGILTTTCSSDDLDPNPGPPSQSPSPSTSSIPSPSPSVTRSPSLTSSPSITQAPIVCNASTCDSCLNAGCAYLGGQNCISSCSIIADTSCYDTSTFPNVTNITEICSRAETIENDATLCSNQNTCTGCLGASLAVPDQSCTWYAVSGSQSSQSRCCLSCDVPGTAVTTCEGIANALDTKSAAAMSRNVLNRISSLLFNVLFISVASVCIY